MHGLVQFIYHRNLQVAWLIFFFFLNVKSYDQSLTSTLSQKKKRSNINGSPKKKKKSNINDRFSVKTEDYNKKIKKVKII